MSPELLFQYRTVAGLRNSPVCSMMRWYLARSAARSVVVVGLRRVLIDASSATATATTRALPDALPAVVDDHAYAGGARRGVDERHVQL